MQPASRRRRETAPAEAPSCTRSQVERSASHDQALDAATVALYRHSLEVLLASGAPILVGGAYAFGHYTGIERHTKDLDVFLRRSDLDAALDAMRAAGYAADASFPHWLAKVRLGTEFIDVIFSSGNGIAVVDDGWFEHAVEADVLGVPVRLTPVEEMIWSKAFVMERERYDGADVAHLLLARAASLDWDRLLARFGDHWPVLLAHLVLFRFAYPGHRDGVPRPVLDGLVQRLLASDDVAVELARTCLGTLTSRQQYLVDVEEWRYRDGRLPPTGTMTEAEIAAWTASIALDG